MPGFEAATPGAGETAVWDVVKVPFPYADRPVRQHRPALVIAADRLLRDHNLLLVAMITSAGNRGWPGDVDISDLSLAGLPAASVVRTAKIACIDARDAARLGVLPPADRTDVAERLAGHLGEALGEHGRDPVGCG